MTPSQQPFVDRVVLVTGASGALGQAVARAFRARGAALALTDRNPEKLRSAWSGPTPHGRPPWLHACDLGDATAVAAMVDQAVERLGRLDVVVNVAGAYRGGQPLHETPLETWDTVMESNARSVFHTCRAAIPALLAQGGGAIVNVAARVALGGAAGLGPYAASKAAVVRLTEAMSAELKGAGVRVNCVLPGTIDTPANRAVSPAADASHWVPPEAIADVVVFLASDAARAVHGAVVPVYGLS